MFLKTKIYKEYDSLVVKESFFNVFNLPSHFHDSYCIGYLEKGMKKSIMNEKKYIIPYNAINIINPYEVHSDKDFGELGCHYKMIYLNGELINYIAKKELNSELKHPHFNNEIIFCEGLKSALNGFFNPNEKTGNLKQNLKLLVEQLFKQKYSSNKQELEFPDHKLSRIKESVEHARTHFKDRIDIDQMAQKCRISKYQFIRNFKKETGIPPATYMIICRINYAITLIQNGASIGIAALESGFYDHSQFCKFFKQYTGLSASNYLPERNIIQA